MIVCQSYTAHSPPFPTGVGSRRLGALCWAAVGKDAGFTPLSLLELLKRRGRYRPEQLARLDLMAPFDLVAGKRTWLAALEEAEEFVRTRPNEELGCLHYAVAREAFVMPASQTDLAGKGVQLHFGSPGGVLPQPPERTVR